MTVAKQSNFGERLKTLRTEAGLSISELARQSGVSKQAISNIEKRTRDPNWNTVVKIARVLGVSVGEFDLGQEPAQAEPSDTEDPVEPPPSEATFPKKPKKPKK